MTITAGPVFWILLVLAIAAVVIFFERLIELRRAHIDWQDFLNGVINVLDGGGEDEALAICEDTAVPVANIVATAIRHRKGAARVLRDAVDSAGRAETGRLDRRLASLSIIGQISPGIGLLGVIFGFMKTVMMVADSSLTPVSRADILASSMEALVSAAMGLMVAIPVAVMYGVLRTRMDRLVLEFEAAASSILGYIANKEAAAKEARK